MSSGFFRLTFTGELAPVVRPASTLPKSGIEKLFSTSSVADSRKLDGVGDAPKRLDSIEGTCEMAVGLAVGLAETMAERSADNALRSCRCALGAATAALKKQPLAARNGISTDIATSARLY